MIRMLRRRKAAFLAAVAAASLFLSSCSFFNNIFGLNKDDGKDTPALVVTIYTVIDEASKSLMAKSGYSSAEAKIIADGANAAVKADGAVSTDFDHLFPVAVGGAVASLTPAAFPGWTDAQKIACVNSITAIFVAELNGKFDATSQARSTRDLTASANAVNALLARLSKAAVSNLAKTGISSANIGAAASGVVSTMIGSLADGGVNKVLVSDALGKITQAAVQTLKDAGLSDADSLKTAVTAITKGAVMAVTNVSVSGVAAADYPALATQIAQGAAEGIGLLSTTSDDVKGLAGAVAAGAAAGVIEVKKAAAEKVDDATLISMAQGVTSGATAGVLNLDLVKGSSSAATSFVTEVSKGASTAFAAAVAGTTISEAMVQQAVAVGATAGAVANNIAAADMTAAVIAIQGSALSAQDITDAIAAGVTKGTNHAPTLSGWADKSATVSAAVTLTATATDQDSDTLTYSWSFTDKPNTSAVALAPSADGTTATFTPNVTGIYHVSLKVGDGKTVVEFFCAINVAADASSATYQGVTAADRLAKAKAYRASGDFGLARDELLILVTYYPENSLTAEATLWLGINYWDLGSPLLGKPRFQAVIDNYKDSSTPSVQDTVAAAHDLLGWVLGGVEGSYDLALDQFNLAKDSKTRWGADSVHGLGWVALQKGNFADALSYNSAAYDSAYADYQVRFNAKQNIAGTYKAQGNLTDAETAQKALSAPTCTCSDGANYSTVDLGVYLNAITSLYWFYSDTSQEAKGVAVLEAAIAASTPAPKNWMKLKLTRLEVESYLWHQAATAANFAISKEKCIAALASYTGSDVATQKERAWMQLRLGQAWGRLSDTAKTAAEKKTDVDAAIAAYALVEADLSTSWGARPAGEAMDEHGILLIWQEPDYAAAEAIFNKVIATYPLDIDQYPRALAYHRLGSVNMERGNNAKYSYGEDYATVYTKALYYFGKSSKASNPSLDSSSWFFRESARNIGTCYSNLKQYDRAISYLSALVTDPLFTGSPSDLAPLYCDLANARGEQIRQLADEGKFAQITADMQSVTDAAFKTAANFKVDGAYPKNGEQSASAWANLGRLYKDVAWQMESYGYGDSDAAKAAIVAATWQAGIDAYSHVTFDNYPSLDTNQWEFYESLTGIARCYEGKGRWTDATFWAKSHEQFQSVVDLITAGKISNERLPDVLQQDAEAYMQQAYGTSWKVENREAIKALDLAGIAAFQKVLDAGKSYDDGNGAAWARGQMVEAYENLGNLTNMSGPGVGTDFALRQGYAASVKALLNASGAFMKSDGTTLVEGGKPAAHGYRSYGWILRNNTSAYRDYYYKDTTANAAYADWPAKNLTSLPEAETAFAAAEAFVGAEPWTVMDSRNGLCRVYIDEANAALNNVSPDTAAAASFMNKAFDEAASAITDDATLAQYPARAIESLMWACAQMGPQLLGLLPEFKDADTLVATVQGYYDIVTTTYPSYAAVDGGNLGQNCLDALNNIKDWRANYTPPTNARSLAAKVASAAASPAFMPKTLWRPTQPRPVMSLAY